MKLALFIADPDIRINQQIALGLSCELQRHDPWQIIMTPDNLTLAAHRKIIRDEKPDAVVIREGQQNDALLEFLETLSVPVVMVASNEIRSKAWPIVIPDDQAIGLMAAEYLLEQQFDHIALLTFAPIAGAQRAEAFRERISKAHKAVEEFHLPIPKTRQDHPASPQGNPGKLLRWLQKLPKPCAIFAHSDQPGAYVVRICAEHGIQVPHEISVLGVDDDALFCHTVYPNLSSIHVPNGQIGAEAARLIRDWKPGYRIVNISPATVVEHGSIRSPAISDPLVNMAVEHLQSHVSEGVRVVDLQTLTGLSPQLLVYRFRNAIGKTPMEVILKERISLARKWLHETDMPIGQIAKRCGFKSANQFFVTFRKVMGMSPKGYREQFRM